VLNGPSGEDAAQGQRPWYLDPVVWLVFAAAIAVDQITKAVVTAQLARGESWPDDGFFRVTYARNSGTAFGLFQDQGTLLTIISIGAVAALVYFFRGSGLRSLAVRIPIGVMLGGAIGNLIDRVRYGYVVDFIDIGTWPIFNAADSFITTGITALVVITVLYPHLLSGEESPGHGSEPPGVTDEPPTAGPE
jgi:signal peptidase II